MSSNAAAMSQAEGHSPNQREQVNIIPTAPLSLNSKSHALVPCPPRRAGRTLPLRRPREPLPPLPPQPALALDAESKGAARRRTHSGRRAHRRDTPAK
ncbi:hypothetical protein ACCO45_003422 [Purpureocillium lilacinum]|uniref:Uncharacterized protein n=1 Tax=Purpureocillium lilacinum TaxID=33203 RepID=A0ACC4E187_PURLI